MKQNKKRCEFFATLFKRKNPNRIYGLGVLEFDIFDIFDIFEFDRFIFDMFDMFELEPEFDMFDIFELEPEFDMFDIFELEPEFDMFDIFELEPEFDMFIFEFALLAFDILTLTLVLAVSPQAAPRAATAKTADKAKVFLIEINFSCLLKRLYFAPKARKQAKIYLLGFRNIGQYKFLLKDSQPEMCENFPFFKKTL